MKYFLVWSALLLSLGLNGQNIRFYTTTDAREVIAGSFLEVNFVLENSSDAQNFKPPDFGKFVVVSGPSRSSQMSIINGTVSQSVTYGYSLKAPGTGAYTIEAASIKVGGTELKTKPIRISVVKGSQIGPGPDREIFVRMIASDTTAFVGQQVILQYKLYTTLDVRTFDIIYESPYEGFYSEDLNQVRSGFKREIINGIEYYTKILKSKALFPQQTGIYEIEGAVANLGIATQRSRSSFFFSNQLRPQRMSTNGISISVRNLPQTNREDFSGAVGQYTMKASVNKRSFTTDDAIVVNMSIAGNGDARMVLPPSWSMSDSLDMYDPNVTTDHTSSNTSGIQHRKSFEYLIIPKVKGRYKIQPSFTYFDPDSNVYITLSSGPFVINVAQGSRAAAVNSGEEIPEIEEIYMTSRLIATKDVLSYKKSRLLIISLLITAFISMAVFKYYLVKSGKLDPEAIRRVKAFEMAKSRLEKAKDYKDREEAKAFYEEIVLALKKYLGDKFNFPALYSKKQEVLDHLDALDFTPEEVSAVERIFTLSERALYAPGSSPNGMDTIYQDALSLISGIEQNKV